MIHFPEDRYSDIRIENRYQTDITIENKVLRQNKTRVTQGAMIRIYDGDKWYYAATTRLDDLQGEVDRLAAMSRSNKDIRLDKTVSSFEVHQDVCLRYQAQPVNRVPQEEKLALLQRYSEIAGESAAVVICKAYYRDTYETRHFLSSKGADILFDFQSAAVAIRYNLTVGGKQGRGSRDIVKTDFASLSGYEDAIREEIEKDIEFFTQAKPVEEGRYTCVLAPLVTGVFAHESFGHKSEADFMIGDEAMMKAWAIGSVVGSPELNITDRGDLEGSGYVPYDDEGTKARCNDIIKDGRLTGRLHSAATSASLQESLTGNARALHFEFEPIVRMTHTSIEPGNLSKDELLSTVEKGLFIETLYHGSGMTTFTIAPHRAYMIRDGKIAEPVLVSVISGNVMETLHKIDGFSREVGSYSFALGGCGKMEQAPLRVGFGGPFIRVNDILVQ
ncbi:MAG: TldD/PmbA family protein [Ruminococcaceae bacterium]|nr:TldD/PmbA family protein [Oscillospiraceae bacterium]